MPRQVSPKIYDKHYYLKICEASSLTEIPEQVSPRLRYLMNLADIRPGITVLDVGCGTGDLCFAAALRGANIVGIDYSKDAIDACKVKQRKSGKLRGAVSFHRVDATKLKRLLKGKTFDVVFMADVVEHLYPEQLETLFKDLRKNLGKGSQICIHTGPNLDFYRYGYPLIRFLWPVLRHIPPAKAIIETKENWKGRKRLPKDPEEGSHNKLGHVNEQTPRSLRKTLVSCGYTADVRVVPFLRPLEGTKIKVIYAVLSIPGIRTIFGADIVAVARRT